MPLRPEYKPPRKVNAVSKRQASVEAARRQLGFQTAIPLEQGLRSLVAWWHEQRSAARS
jgi:UDP-glucose 4-epimerase